jgi:hypothetical protein
VKVVIGTERIRRSGHVRSGRLDARSSSSEARDVQLGCRIRLRDVETMLKPLGIEKDQPFAPDARQRAILEEAATLGDAMGRTMLFDGHERISGANAFPGTHWDWVTLVSPHQETDTYSQLDERLHYTYGAIYTSPSSGRARRARLDLRPGLQGQGWRSPGRRQVLPTARASERTRLQRSGR